MLSCCTALSLGEAASSASGLDCCPEARSGRSAPSQREASSSKERRFPPVRWSWAFLGASFDPPRSTRSPRPGQSTRGTSSWRGDTSKGTWSDRMAIDPANATPTLEAPSAQADGRRLDIDAKQHLVAQHIHECECEGMLVLHPANFRWLTAGANPVGFYGRDETPGLYFNSQQRWLLASATDSQRLFTDELDGLGFM